MINLYLTSLDYEEQNKDREQRFKESLMQAFPHSTEKIFPELNKSSGINSDYEQVVPSNQEEYLSLQDFISQIHTMEIEDE